MSTDELYPVYSSINRPGFGWDLAGNLRTNSFCITLAKDAKGLYLPFLFSDLIQQFNLFSDNLGTCDNCVAKNGSHVLPCAGYEIDLSAYVRKFSQGEFEVNENDYRYCSLIQQVFKNSLFDIHTINEKSNIGERTSVKPLNAILEGNWDDPYLFQLKSFTGYPILNQCQVIKSFLSSDHISTSTEKQFLGLWLHAMFQIMGIAGKKAEIFLGEEDIDWKRSQLFRFIFPIPQVWLQVIPPPPYNVSWQDWNKKHEELKQPQRVDFLFTFRGKRHIIEIDGKSHYSSEAEYRKTLIHERWLKASGFEVHRFTNEEINEIYAARVDKPNGFVQLLEMIVRNPEELVLIEK